MNINTGHKFDAEQFLTDAVILFMDNDYDLYTWATVTAADISISNTQGTIPSPAYVLSERIKDHLLANMPRHNNTIYSSILRCAMDSIDYIKVARYYLVTARELTE